MAHIIFSMSAKAGEGLAWSSLRFGEVGVL